MKSEKDRSVDNPAPYWPHIYKVRRVSRSWIQRAKETMIPKFACPNLPYNVKLIRAPASKSGLPADRPLMPYRVNRILSDKGVL